MPAGHRLQLRLTSTDLPTHFPGWARIDPDGPESVQIEVHSPATNTVRLGASHLLIPSPAPGRDR